MNKSNNALHEIYVRCKKATRVDEEGRVSATSDAGACVLDILKIVADAIAPSGEIDRHCE